jgi:hypothetical protein
VMGNRDLFRHLTVVIDGVWLLPKPTAQSSVCLHYERAPSNSRASSARPRKKGCHWPILSIASLTDQPGRRSHPARLLSSSAYSSTACRARKE